MCKKECDVSVSTENPSLLFACLWCLQHFSKNTLWMLFSKVFILDQLKSVHVYKQEAGMQH